MTVVLIGPSVRLRGRQAEERTAALHGLIRSHFTNETFGVDALPWDAAEKPNCLFVSFQSGSQIKSERVGQEEM